jgi:hypothetical protein
MPPVMAALPLSLVLWYQFKSTCRSGIWLGIESEYAARTDVVGFERRQLARADRVLELHEPHRLAEPRTVECVTDRARIREVRLLTAQRDVFA